MPLDEIVIAQAPNTTRIEIPFDVPTALIDGGAVLLYATQKCGWKPKIIQTTNVNGVITNTEIDNPINPLTAVALKLRSNLREEYALLLKQKAAKEAIIAAQQQFNALFSS